MGLWGIMNSLTGQTVVIFQYTRNACLLILSLYNLRVVFGAGFARVSPSFLSFRSDLEESRSAH